MSAKKTEDKKTVSKKAVSKPTWTQETYIDDRGDLRVITKFADGTKTDREL